MAIFADRVDGGRRLAQALESLRGQDIVVLGLPRGGVPVAAEVAEALDAPLDVIVVRKLGVPFQPELAMGAIGEDDVRVLDRDLVAALSITDAEVERVERRERISLEQRVARFRRGRKRLDLNGRIAVIVDDGLATGSTARAACAIARKQGAARVIVAVPVAPAETARNLTEADTVVCLATPEHFMAVGAHYRDFSPTSEDEVSVLLDAASRRMTLVGAAGAADCPTDTEVEIPVDGSRLHGRLYLPENPLGIVVFAHGSGSSRHSPRNRYVAEVLQRAGLGTLLLDLLTTKEESRRSNVFDVGMLAARLLEATKWLSHRPDTSACAVGYFGASTGAAAALLAAAASEGQIAAVVSRGGRPDLAGPVLDRVTAPTLLIVGGEDDVVLDLNRKAQARLRCVNRLEVVAGATHLFEEPGTLAEVAGLASEWFRQYLPRDHPPIQPPTQR